MRFWTAQARVLLPAGHRVIPHRARPHQTSAQVLQMPAAKSSYNERAQHFFRQPGIRLTLGSASYSRKAIMEELAAEYAFSFDILTADIDERAIGDRSASPKQLVLNLGRAKAEAILKKLPAPPQPLHFLITCDQVVVHEGKVLEKPESAQEARAFIAGYSRAPAATVGSVVVRNMGTGKQVEAVDTARIHFQPIPEEVVAKLVEEGLVFRCAGGLMIEHPLVEPLITRIEGTPDSVMGLPKALVLQGLLQASEP